MRFGLARGKSLSPGQFGIHSSDLPPYDSTNPDSSRIDPRTWFPPPLTSSRRFEIEIGSGKGTFLLQQAKLQPDINYLGIESAGEFYRYAADRMRRHNLTNVRILFADATEFLHFHCADNVASVIHLYFSDPWPKSRHHKRRVIQDRTLLDMHRVLSDGGELRLVTDHDDLWTWYEDHAARHESYFERCPFESPVSAGEDEFVGTNFERKYRTEGRPFHAMTLVKH